MRDGYGPCRREGEGLGESWDVAEEGFGGRAGEVAEERQEDTLRRGRPRNPEGSTMSWM